MNMDVSRHSLTYLKSFTEIKENGLIVKVGESFGEKFGDLAY